MKAIERYSQRWFAKTRRDVKRNGEEEKKTIVTFSPKIDSGYMREDLSRPNCAGELFHEMDKAHGGTSHPQDQDHRQLIAQGKNVPGIYCVIDVTQ
jgi:hypothetical protein